MISKSILEKAVNKNILTSDQVEPLHQFLLQQEETVVDQSPVNKLQQQEPLRFIRSFGDVFITLGIVLMVIAINMTSVSGYYYLVPIAIFIVLAEWLVGVRKLVLPGMAILISILYFVNRAMNIQHDDASMIGLAIVCITSLLFYLRYRMPFSLLPLSAGLVIMATMQIGLDVLKTPVIFALFGLLVFVVALWFDSRDTQRISHMSDSGFWLHLVAAPLIVHGVMASMLTSNSGVVEMLGKEVIIIAFFIVFFFVALLIDRRAMLVATQLYVIYSLTQLLRSSLDNVENITIYVLILFGIFIIYFGTYWYKTRRLVFGFLADHPLSRFIPDLHSQDNRQVVR